MHTSLLERYFDVEAWHRDLFIALLDFEPEWTWQELSDAFMQVCCHLHTPRGSASQRPDWIDHMNRLGWCSVECAKGETDASKIIVRSRAPALPGPKRPRCRPVLLKAVRWSMERRLVEDRWKKIIADAYVKLNSIPENNSQEVIKACDELEKFHLQRDAELETQRRTFRLTFRKKARGAATERSGS